MSRRLLAFLNTLPASEKQKLDLTFRLSFLEGVAKKDAGDWTRRPMQGALQARAFFEGQKIPMDPDWFGSLSGSPWVVELARRVYGLVLQFQKNLDAVGVDADMIETDLLASINSPKGTRQSKVFYSFGLSWTNEHDVKDLSTTPPNAKEVIGPGLTVAVAQFIKAVLEKRSNRVQLMGPTTQQISPHKSLTREEQMERLMVEQPPDEDHEEAMLIDLMGDQLGVGNAILNLVEPVIDRSTKDEVGRFALKRFFSYLTNKAYNIYEPGPGRDKRPDRSKMWAMLNRIREQVRVDMLEHFDPQGTKTEDEKEKFLRRLYNIIGSAGRGSGGDTGLPKGILKILSEVVKSPSVEKLLKRFEEEKDRLNLGRTASVVNSYRIMKAKQSLGLLGVLLCMPPEQWA